MNLFRALLFNILLSAISTISFASENDKFNSPELNYLINEKANLIDIGFLRLNESIKQVNLFELAHKNKFYEYEQAFKKGASPE